jgi:hypothetical protein
MERMDVPLTKVIPQRPERDDACGKRLTILHENEWFVLFCPLRFRHQGVHQATVSWEVDSRESN